MIFERYQSDQQEERRIRRWRTGQRYQGYGVPQACPPIRYPEDQLQGYRQMPEVIGGMVAGEEQAYAMSPGIKWSAVATGVLTGVSVWLATRLLDRAFNISK